MKIGHFFRLTVGLMFATATSLAHAADVPSGKANAMVSDNAVLAGLIFDDKDKFTMLPDTFTVEPYGIGIKKGEDKFTAEVNQALKVLRKNGTYARLMKKWFNGVPGFNIKSSSRLKASK